MYFKALQSFYRAFIPPAGIARARCPPEFAYVFRAFIAERYRGGDRAGRPAIWLRPIPALELMAIFANFLFANSDIILIIIMLRAIRIIVCPAVSADARQTPYAAGALIVIFIKTLDSGEPQDQY